jgi:hypothetical protein
MNVLGIESKLSIAQIEAGEKCFVFSTPEETKLTKT